MNEGLARLWIAWHLATAGRIRRSLKRLAKEVTLEFRERVNLVLQISESLKSNQAQLPLSPDFAQFLLSLPEKPGGCLPRPLTCVRGHC